MDVEREAAVRLTTVGLIVGGAAAVFVARVRNG
jgi:hypothetical protein